MADPYRWLEDDRAPETAKWVAEENLLTNDYLARIPYRAQIKDRLQARVNYARYSAPFQHGKYVFYYKNSSKRIEETADIYAFLFYNLGVKPTY